MSRTLLLFFLFISSFSFAQETELDTVLAENERLYPFDMKYTGSEFFVDMNYQYMLEQLMDTIQQNPSLHLHIRGHVCCGPSYRLSKKRAKQVYKYLKRAGLDKSRMSYKGYSDKAPLRWPEETEEDQIANRRVDFVIREMKK